MIVKFGSARQDENGKYTGGKPGDQTTKEVSTQNYYMHNKGWYTLRPRSSNVADKLAKEMKDACANNNIGYSQSDRYSVVKEIKKVTHMKSIKIKVNADCSSLVRSCIFAATGKDVGDFNTSNEAKALEDSGLFEKRKSVNSADDLHTGDVLVSKQKGHTVIVTEGKTRGDNDRKSYEEVAKEVIAGKWGNGEERKKNLKTAGYDYETVRKMVNSLLK